MSHISPNAQEGFQSFSPEPGLHPVSTRCLLLDLETAGELLRDAEVDASFDLSDRHADTKVMTAIAWLERAAFLQRNENHTRVFQGKHLVKSLGEAAEKISQLNLSP